MLTIKPNRNTHYNVKNLQGTTGMRCSCRSWLTHWEKSARSRRVTCAVVGCSQMAKVGAHVLSVDRRTDRQWWIAPFCSYHNHYTIKGNVFLNSQATLVSANRSYTCQNDSG